MLDRIGKGDRISLGDAILLFISLFLPWYKVSVSIGGISRSESGHAFETLKYTDIILLLISIAVVAIIILIAQGTLDAALAPIVLVVGAIATLLILYRMIDKPGPDVDGLDVGLGFGIFLGLIGAVAIAVGQVMKAQER